MRAGPNQRLWQPWDISQTRSRTMGRCEHRSNVLKRAPTITGTRVPGSWNTCSEGSREMRARPNKWLWGTRQHLMTLKLCKEFRETSGRARNTTPPCRVLGLSRRLHPKCRVRRSVHRNAREAKPTVATALGHLPNTFPHHGTL